MFMCDIEAGCPQSERRQIGGWQIVTSVQPLTEDESIPPVTSACGTYTLQWDVKGEHYVCTLRRKSQSESARER